MLSKNDILISLVLSFGIFGISLGIMGVANFSFNLIFLVITLMMSLMLFGLFKPIHEKSETSSRGYAR